MARLYYDKTKEPALFSKETVQESDPTKEYLEKVAKIIPSEIIAAYLAMIGLAPLVEFDKFPNIDRYLYYGIFLLCLVSTVWYMDFQALKGKPKTVHIILSLLSFIFWAYSTTGEKLLPDLYNAALASILLIAFSLLSGRINLE